MRVVFSCEVGGRGGRCSLLMFLFCFSKVCAEKWFQEKVLPCPGNKLLARQPKSVVVPIFFPTSSSLFLLFLLSWLSALGYQIPAFVLSSLLLSYPLSIQLHPATPPNTLFTTHFYYKSPMPSQKYDIQMGGFDPTQWKTRMLITPIYRIPSLTSPSELHVVQFRLQSHLIFCFKYTQVKAVLWSQLGTQKWRAHKLCNLVSKPRKPQ